VRGYKLVQTRISKDVYKTYSVMVQHSLRHQKTERCLRDRHRKKVARGAAKNDMSIVRKWENISHYANTDGFGSSSSCVIKPLLSLSKDSTAYCYENIDK